MEATIEIYEAPAIEQELSSEDIDREVHYAGQQTVVP